MTSTTPSFAFQRHPSAETSTLLRAFRAPPLRAPAFLDIAKDLDALRRRRKLLSQRLNAIWLRGHVRDNAAYLK